MATKLHHSIDFPCPPAQFAAAVADEQYWKDLVANVAADLSDLDSFTDEGDKDRDSPREASFAVGVSDPIHYAWPTISEIQTTDDTETNNLEREYARVRAADREIVVTAREAAGLWVTDLADAPGSFNSFYVYTFSRPDEELVEGARIVELAGIDQEYLASTQLSYPTIETDGTTLTVPDPFALTTCEELEMEGLEGTRVAVYDGQVPATFVEGSEEYLDFETYGQWPLAYGDCTVYIDSGSTVPDFWAPDHVGETLPEVTGMLKQIFDEWVLVVTDEGDILTTTDGARTVCPSFKATPESVPALISKLMINGGWSAL